MAEKPAPTGVRKAAMLLLALGVDASTEVLRHLNQSTAYEVIREASRLGSLDSAGAAPVIQDFLASLPSAKAMGGKAFASEVLKRAFGDEQLLSIEFLKQVDRNQLLEVVQKEHPQVVAFILSYVGPDVAGGILAALPPEQQVDIAQRIAKMETPQREVLVHLERTLSQRLSFLSADNLEVGGTESLVEIMRSVGRNAEQNILEGLARQEPELAEDLKKMMFVFEDLVLLDDRALQRVLKEIEGKTLALALRRASPEIVNRINSNLSERARTIMKEDMEALGRVRARDVDRAQSEVVSVVRRLEEAGELRVDREEEEEFV